MEKELKIFCGDLANGKGKGRKHPEKENAFCRGEEAQRRKRKKVSAPQLSNGIAMAFI